MDKVPTRQEVMDCDAVHNLVKELLKRSKDYDICDMMNDLALVQLVLENEFEQLHGGQIIT